MEKGKAADARFTPVAESQASGSATESDLHAGEQLALAMLKAAKAEIAHLTEERNDIAAMREDLAAEIDRLHDQLAALTEVHERLKDMAERFHMASKRMRKLTGDEKLDHNRAGQSEAYFACARELDALVGTQE